MTITVREETEDLVVPSSVRRQAGIKAGDRLEFKVAPRTITITAAPARTYKPTKAERAAIRRGEAEIARGKYVGLTELLRDLDPRRCKVGSKAARKIAR